MRTRFFIPFLLSLVFTASLATVASAQVTRLDSTQNRISRQLTYAGVKIEPDSVKSALQQVLSVAAHTQRADAKPTVLVAGSSHMAAVAASTNPGFTITVGNRLASEYNFVNVAIGGTKTSYWVTRIAGLIQQYRPVALWFGITMGNDMDEVTTAAGGIRQWLDNYRQIAEICRQNNVVLILCTSTGRSNYTIEHQRYMNMIYRRLGDIPALVFDGASLVDTGDGKILPSLYINDGYHLTDAGYLAWADMMPNEYFRMGMVPPAPPKMDLTAAGLKVTTTATVRPFTVRFGYKSFTFTTQIKHDTNATGGKAAVCFINSLTADDGFRLRIDPDGTLDLATTTGGIIVNGTSKIHTWYKTVTVRYHHTTGKVELFVNGVSQGSATWLTGQTIHEISIGSTSSGSGHATEHYFRNVALNAAPLVDAVITYDIHQQNRVLKNNLLGSWPLTEGNPTFSGQVYQNLYPVPSYLLFSNQQE